MCSYPSHKEMTAFTFSSFFSCNRRRQKAKKIILCSTWLGTNVLYLLFKNCIKTPNICNGWCPLNQCGLFQIDACTILMYDKILFERPTNSWVLKELLYKLLANNQLGTVDNILYSRATEIQHPLPCMWRLVLTESLAVVWPSTIQHKSNIYSTGVQKYIMNFVNQTQSTPLTLFHLMLDTTPFLLLSFIPTVSSSFTTKHMLKIELSFSFITDCKPCIYSTVWMTASSSKCFLFFILHLTYYCAQKALLAEQHQFVSCYCGVVKPTCMQTPLWIPCHP